MIRKNPAAAAFILALGAAAIAAVTIVAPREAAAEVVRVGEWPAAKLVDLDASGSRSEVLTKLADKAGWSLVVAGGLDNTSQVAIHAKQTSVDDLLAAVLADPAIHVQASLKGKLLYIAPASAAAAASASAGVAAAPSTPTAAKRDDAEAASVSAAAPAADVPAALNDRTVTGDDATIAVGETVRDVSVVGGDVDVYGTVTGDLLLTGGDATIHPGGVVRGKADVIGGTLHIMTGGRVDGHTGVVGVQKSDPGSIVGGKASASAAASKPDAPRSFVQQVRDCLSNFALLFVLGSVLLALLPGRIAALRLEAAARPMRNFALGIVGALAFVIGLVVLCVTLVGIPFALVFAVLGTFAAVCALSCVLGLAGELLLRKKTENPYAHLALGTGLYALLSALPYIGSCVDAAAFFIAVGTLVATRGAGYLRKSTTALGPAGIQSTGQAYR